MTELLTRLFVRDWEQTDNPRVRRAYGALGGTVGILCNVFLFSVKLFAGLATGAISIMADAFNNLSDAGASVVTLIGFRMAGKPADLDHPFGHGRIEYLSGLFVAAAIIVMGFELFTTSVDKIFHPEKPDFTPLSMGILILSILVKLWMSRFNHSLGERIRSEAMKATATDSLSDCISTGTVLLGAVFTYFTEKNIDGFIGLVVAVFVLYAGYETAKDTIQPLLGEAPDKDFVDGITRMVMEEPMILGIHDMIVHDYGPGRRIVSLHAEVPYNRGILEIHDVIDNVEQRVGEQFQCEITIHMDPIVTDDQELDEARKMVEKLVREMDSRWKIHDFRMVRGDTHTNLIFDVVVCPEQAEEEEAIQERLKAKIHEADPHYYGVVKAEQSYV